MDTAAKPDSNIGGAILYLNHPHSDTGALSQCLNHPHSDTPSPEQHLKNTINCLALKCPLKDLRAGYRAPCRNKSQR